VPVQELSRTDIRRRYAGIAASVTVLRTAVTDLSGFFAVFASVLSKKDPFWFRGHGNPEWTLTPSALRFRSEAQRNKALQLLSEFRRYVEIRLPKPPSADDELQWVQLARHYGLPTRLLDWTQNAAVALYFACLEPGKDGAVFVINPIDLNSRVDRHRPRVFDAQHDAGLIGKYLRLTGRLRSRGRWTIAVNPVWNSERIILQQGVFTLHGNRDFTLKSGQASSLVALPVLSEHKEALMGELERVGVSEMSIFPEPEHVCSYLTRREGLAPPGV